tara:strand:- start:1414 stop:1875 length:462 start_codon:yes stop_codon:yes gene_type:complete
MKLFEVPKVNNRFMKLIAQEAIDLIISDADNGVFQNNARKKPYKSSTYEKYKRNNMQRFTDGKKLKRFENQSTDTTTQYINMRLTGRTLRGMRASSKKNTAVITYDRGEIVLGNKKTNIYDLRQVNKNKLFRSVEKLYDRNIKKYTAKTITIK